MIMSSPAFYGTESLQCISLLCLGEGRKALRANVLQCGRVRAMEAILPEVLAVRAWLAGRSSRVAPAARLSVAVL